MQVKIPDCICMPTSGTSVERKRLLAGSNPRLHVAWSTSGTQRIEKRVEKVGTADRILHDPDIA